MKIEDAQDSQREMIAKAQDNAHGFNQQQALSSNRDEVIPPQHVERKPKPHKKELQLDYEVKEITPVIVNIFGEVIFWIMSILTLGLVALIFRWCFKVWKSFRYTRVSVEQAKYLIIMDEGDEEKVLPTKKVVGMNNEELVGVEYRYTLYIYDRSATAEFNDAKKGKVTEKGAFVMVHNEFNMTNNQVRAMKSGMSDDKIIGSQRLYGVNSTRIKLTPLWSIFIDEGLSAFNLYQIFAAIIWYFRDYFPYAVFILVMAFVSLLVTCWVHRTEQKKVNTMAQLETVVVYRRKGNEIQKNTISSEELVPGDIFEVKQHKQLPCDAILIEGQCLIDEAALTGESVPMIKTQLPATNADFSESEKGHILFSGTTCITSEKIEDPSQPAVAMVYQTGFNTTKGLLIRAIMFNNPGKYQFEKDGNRFLLYLIGMSICFIIAYYIIAYSAEEKPPFGEVALPSVDITLTMVPPGLTVCLTLGIQYAQARLGLRKISVLKGRLINAAGRMNVCLFDKTGTLTINEVVLEEVYGANLNVDQQRCIIVSKSRDVRQDQEFQKRLCHNFAADHTLVLTKPDAQGKQTTLGDPLEEELYKFARAGLENTKDIRGKNYMKVVRVDRGGSTDMLGVINVFGFKSELQRMSIVVEDSGTGEVYGYVKGAPERIVELSDPQTLPKDINQQITDFAKNGFRVIAFGSKKLPALASGQEYTREMSEEKITFQGLALFKNNLKEATKPTLDKLKQAGFYTGMITGDNINTAISVSKSCGLVDITQEDIAICTYTERSGKLNYTLINAHGDPVGQIDPKSRAHSDKAIIGAMDNINFEKISKELGLELNKPIDLEKDKILIEISENVRVFARMNPQQKALIVKIFKEYYKSKNYTVGFCGDGANDCIALKHADIGVSLSKNEASLSAPFVSAIEDISCIEHVSIQGKCALTSNFDIFRYFCLYSVIQTIGLIFLFANKTEYSVPMYLTMDIPIALNLANAMGLLSAAKTLTKKLPKHTLFYLKFMTSLLWNILLTFAVIIFGLWMIKGDEGFYAASDAPEPSDEAIDDSIPTYESTLISLVAIQGTFHVAMSFSLQGMWKDRFFVQVYFMISLLLYMLYMIYLIFNARNFWPAVDNFLMDQYNFVIFDKSMRWYVFILCNIYSLLSILYEVLMIWVFVDRKKKDKDKVSTRKIEIAN